MSLLGVDGVAWNKSKTLEIPDNLQIREIKEDFAELGLEPSPKVLDWKMGGVA